MTKLEKLHQEIIACRACPRLVEWREEVARVKRRAYRDWDYWGKPVPGFGDPKARLIIVGLAPAAHGANRTGRMFTGDRSGDFLYAGLQRSGFANQGHSEHRDDGLKLTDAFIVAAGRCAPPDNKPLPEELARCAPFLDREMALLPGRVLLALGAIGWNAALASAARTGSPLPTPRPAFGHGAEYRLPDGRWLVGSYHVSQQNTQTGRLTPAMFDAVMKRVRALLET
ncbi:uracil-DNA glycosylase [Corallococcus sp. AB004]|uniref:Type-5 uracil-DNA glycosylase n=1 Tax=Corallococcus exiguus TaxID=83462 RepID=A0A7X4Y7A9_9BACT|nr:uracil-DNA glycosylase [Corallococcus exiguus]RKI41751.1 uracil-DNA glycosylase [Corallococcus sp. AB004]NBC40238.1 uracil-DNA glycosylase [Corallococcus exiguus]NPC69966.1 uracil-DNA glycosylase [Corallococcus exiguus]NPD22744.1 uracil-DNA glycosylase [Corallococcus exiguus]TNV66398.1 uracil-DNA glycosylase [Corallococcus exiguus]